ncbi:MAG: acetylglutamate kinase [Acetivibrio sp.]
MDAYMEEVMTKASTLIEALPYIREFNNKIVVVKYGGSAMLSKERQESVIRDVALLKLVGMQPVIVHGGGKEISSWLSKIGKESEFVKGFRVTDEETMEVAEMVLNRVNKTLVQMLEKVGVKAVGISGKDGSLLKVEKKRMEGEDLGFVGEVKTVHPEVVHTLLKNDFIPVIAPIGTSEDFETYNINADDAACAIARAIKAEKLAFLTDTEGVYKNPEDKNSLITAMTVTEAESYIKEGFIGGGMLPKLQNCIDAVKDGVSRVHILDGRIKNCLLLEFFTQRGIGTAISNNKRYSNEE